MDILQNTTTRISIQSLLSPADSKTQKEQVTFDLVKTFDNSTAQDKSTHEEQAILSLMMISTQPQKSNNNTNNNNNNNNNTATSTTPSQAAPSNKQKEEFEDEVELSDESSQDDDSDFEDYAFQRRASKKRKQPSKALTQVLTTNPPTSTSQRTELSDSDSGLSPTVSFTSSPSVSPSKSTEDLPIPEEEEEDEEDDDEDEDAERAPRKHKKARRNRFNDDLWFEHFDELKKFKKKYGHCNVTQAFTQWRVLANWVHNQRKHQGKRMPPNRRQMLVELGFEFDRSYAAVSHVNKLKAAMRRAAEAQKHKDSSERK